MIVFWFGLLVLSMGLTRTSGIYSPLGETGPGVLVLGMALMCVAFRRLEPSRRSHAVWLGAAAIPLLFFLPGSRYASAALLLGAGLSVAARRAGVFRRLGNGLLWTAQLALLLHGAGSAYFHLSPMLKDLEFLSGPLVWMLRALGAEANLDGGAAFVRTVERLVDHRVSIDHLCPFPAALMFAGGSLGLILARRVRTIAPYAVVFASYLFLRHVILVLIVAESGFREVFWSQGALLLSFALLPLILSFLFGGRLEGQVGTPPHAQGVGTTSPGFSGGFAQAAVGLLAAFLVLFGALFPDPGARKAGRLLIDEGHSDWERTTRPMDTHWFGEESTYNYYSMRIYLEHFYEVEITEDTLDATKLADHDVLILKTPTRAYRESEIDAIEDFVRNGGGLWLIGDHTNVFGITTHLNPISERFGFAFGYDVTYDLHSGGLSLYTAPSGFRHPIVRNLDAFLFATSCTIEPSLTTQRVMLGPGLLTLPLDYSQPGFFPVSVREHWQNTFGVFLQTAAATRGKGRVAGFSDSTCFSNFFMHVPGKPELVLGTVEWLNRTNRYTFLRPVFVTAGILLLTWLIWRRRKVQSGPLVAGLLVGTAIAAGAVDLSGRASYSAQAPHTPYTSVVMEQEHSRFFLPIRQLLGGTDSEHFLSFYIWVQRLGWVPSVMTTFEDAVLSKPDVLVVLRPQEPFTSEEVGLLRDYLEGGGGLLVLDDSLIAGSTANQLLEPFEMSIHYEGDSRDAEGSPVRLVDADGNPVMDVEALHPVRGGLPLLQAEDGRGAAVAYRRVGPGSILVCSAAYLFSTAQMGHTSVIPTARQRQIYELEYWLLRAIKDQVFDRPLDSIREAG